MKRLWWVVFVHPERGESQVSFVDKAEADSFVEMCHEEGAEVLNVYQDPEPPPVDQVEKAIVRTESLAIIDRQRQEVLALKLKHEQEREAYYRSHKHVFDSMTSKDL